MVSLADKSEFGHWQLVIDLSATALGRPARVALMLQSDW
jgi:hypothetical protein